MIAQKVSKNVYEQLCESVDVTPIDGLLNLNSFSEVENFAELDQNQRLTAAINVLLDLSKGQSTVVKIDKVLLDSYIAKIDHMLSEQLDEILHAPEFQTLESTWCGLKYLVDRTDFKSNIRIDLIDVDKESLREDFSDAPDVTQSGLYKHIYVQEYDTPGGEPYSSIVSGYEFDSGNNDVALLRDLSKVAAAAHCPFLGSVGAKFFGKSSLEEVMKIDDIDNYMERAEFIRWNGFRETEDARYVGLTFPRFLLRLPYGTDSPVRSFHYEEKTNSKDHEKFLWGSAAFAMAANMCQSFKQNGWLVNIRGPQAGGKVENLLLHQYDAGRGLQTKIPSESLISETRELAFANLGFIPLSYYKNSDYACFFSANSVQRPAVYVSKDATANSRINARLPYIFLSSRIGHYLKVLQRENIGSVKDKAVLARELNEWLQTLVTEMDGSDPEVVARYPLREGAINVESIEDNVGYYRVSMFIKPHFQIEGVDIRLSLVGKLPTGAGNA
jgi:type VI secretion system protein ImpC